MTNLLRIQSSLFNGQGKSSALATRFIERWLVQHPHGRVVSRDLAAEPVPHLSLERFTALTTPPEGRTVEQHRVVAFSDALIDELKNADVIVLAVPMYNFTVPSVLHAWFDHIARAGVTFRYTANGAEGLLNGKRAYVFITRGGIHGEDHAQSAFIRQILGFIGITDVEIVHAEGLALSEDSMTRSMAAAERLIAQLTAAPA